MHDSQSAVEAWSATAKVATSIRKGRFGRAGPPRSALEMGDGCQVRVALGCHDVRVVFVYVCTGKRAGAAATPDGYRGGDHSTESDLSSAEIRAAALGIWRSHLAVCARSPGPEQAQRIPAGL